MENQTHDHVIRKELLKCFLMPESNICNTKMLGSGDFLDNKTISFSSVLGQGIKHFTSFFFNPVF